MYGPIEGRRHDAFMLGESGLLDKLRRFEKPNGDPYIIYGDPAYGLTPNIMSPFRGAHLTDNEQEFNTRMSKVRVSVEWEFWENNPNVCIFRLQKELESTPSACWQVLFGG